MGIPVRILIIEDTEPDAELVVRELQDDGYDPEYEIVETPEAMVAALDKQAWDVVISDYLMPHFSGLDALRMVQEKGLDIPFIIVSGKISDNLAAETMVAGAKDYVLKSNLSRLVPAVKREIIDTRRRRRANEARMQAEEALRRALDEQEQRIAERTAELSKANWLLSREITERNRVEEELAEARAYAERKAAEFQSFVSSMADGLGVVDANGECVYMNKAGRQMLGIPEEEPCVNWLTAYSRYSLDGEVVPQEQTVSFRALQGETVIDTRYKVVGPWGKEIAVSASASPIRDTEGGVVGATVVFRDQKERIDLEREREGLYEREHHIAEILQQALIPPMETLKVGTCSIAVKYEPALMEAEVGGDFYDVFGLGEGKFGIVIGDVAGKGLVAAIYVAAAKHAIRSYAYLFPSPARIMTLANEALCKEQTEDQAESSMMTVFLAIVDTQHGTMTYASAGHDPPVVRDAAGNVQHLNGAHDIPLAIECGYDYSETSRTLAPGDTVVIATDGITEARPNSMELFGKDGIAKYLQEYLEIPIDRIPSGLLEAARLHAGGHLKDDAAIVAFTCDTVRGDKEQDG